MSKRKPRLKSAHVPTVSSTLTFFFENAEKPEDSMFRFSNIVMQFDARGMVRLQPEGEAPGDWTCFEHVAEVTDAKGVTYMGFTQYYGSEERVIQVAAEGLTSLETVTK